MIKVHVFNGWKYMTQYNQLNKWVIENSDAADWNPDSGISYINGEIYMSSLNLSSEEDYIYCKLRFPDIVL